MLDAPVPQQAEAQRVAQDASHGQPEEDGGRGHIGNHGHKVEVNGDRGLETGVVSLDARVTVTTPGVEEKPERDAGMPDQTLT